MQAAESNDRVMYWGTGRRKSAVARVRLVPGTGQLIVNGRAGESYFNYNSGYLSAAKAPLETLGLENEYDILVNAHGGGLTGQADSIRLGVARALCELDPDNRLTAKNRRLLDSRPTGKRAQEIRLTQSSQSTTILEALALVVVIRDLLFVVGE
jgi:Ribosomal protein S9